MDTVIPASDSFGHIPILLDTVIDNLRIDPEGLYVDGTLGGAGHSSEIVRRLKGGHLIGIDRDADAIEAAADRLRRMAGEASVRVLPAAGYAGGADTKVTIVKANYGSMADILSALGIDRADGILLDLGVSSHQLDDPQRGFSYMHDAPLDMRMDRDEELTAADIVNGYSQQELSRIIREYGEDNFAQNIAKHIAAARAKAPIETTAQLAQIVSEAIPMKIRKTGGHPAKRTFQAIRIELNRELTVLEDTLAGMIDLLAPGGRMCVITFHSLEDRIVKNVMRKAENPCTCPPGFPVCRCGAVSRGRVITRKPIIPPEEEMESNPRSKSAKLRVFEHC